MPQQTRKISRATPKTRSKWINKYFFCLQIICEAAEQLEGFRGGSVVKNLPAKAGDAGFSPWVREDPLEQEIATHSSVLAWGIPWTEDPGWLWSIGSQRVRHNWTAEHTHTHSNWKFHTFLVVISKYTLFGLLWKQFGSFLKVKYILPYDLTIMLQSIYPRKWTHMTITHFVWLLIEDLFATAENWKYPKCLSTGQLINCSISIHTMDFQSTPKKN